MPTLTQLLPLLRLFAPVLVGILTQYIGADAATQLVSVILTLLGSGGWSLYANKQSSLAQTVASFKGAIVQVDHTADPSLQTLAADPKVKDIIPAPAGMGPPPYSSNRSKS